MRIGPPGQERPVVRVDNHHFVDVSDLVADFDKRRNPETRSRADRLSDRSAAPDLVHRAELLRPCHPSRAADTHRANRVHKVTEEHGRTARRVRIPRGADTLDWEVELGVVMGRCTSYLNAVADAADAIAGFVLVNDISERTFQRHRGGQWCKGKSAETFNPTGPWLATPDEIQDLDDLDIWLDVNGIRRQTGSTKTMIFSVWEIVHHLSQFMVLEPGDLIDTGTPPGVGQAQDPPTYLQAGDQLEFGIQHLGIQLHQVLAPSEAAA